MTELTKAEHVKLVWREVELTRRRDTIKAEVGCLVLNGETSDRMARATTDLQATEAGIELARSQRMDVIRAKRTTEIRALQDRRAALEEERKLLFAEVEKHKSALVTLLGVEVAIKTGPRRYSNLDTLILKITALADQIRRLQEPLPDAGVVDVDNVTTNDGLIEALAAFEGPIPQMQETLKWLEAVEAGRAVGDRPRRIHFVWNGTINYQESYIFVESMCQPGPIGIYSNKPCGIDMRSGTFHAREAARV